MTSFSTLIRGILENSEKFYMHLDDELDMLKLYVDLENLRFGNSIKYTVELNLLSEESIPVGDKQKFCEMTYHLYRDVLDKGGDRVVDLLRYFFSP